MRKLLLINGMILVLCATANIFGAADDRWMARSYTLPSESVLKDRFGKISPVITHWVQHTRVTKELANQESTVLLAAVMVECAFVKYLDYLKKAGCNSATIAVTTLMLGNKGAEPDILRAIFKDNSNPQAMKDVESLIQSLTGLGCADGEQDATLKEVKI